MGDNGTLQDAAGNEVQGWMMSPIDSQNDVTSTNQMFQYLILIIINY